MHALIDILLRQLDDYIIPVHSVFPCCFFSTCGCQPFTSPFPLGACVCFGEGGKWKGELQRASSVQDFSMAYLVVSQTVSLPSIKMWLPGLGIASLLCLMSPVWFLVSSISCNLKGCASFDLHDRSDMFIFDTSWLIGVWLPWLKVAETTKIWILAATMWVLVPQGPFLFWRVETALLGVRECQVLPVAVCGSSSPSSGE